MVYFFYTIIIFFLYINIKIIISDIKYKKIPNKYLVYLISIVPFYYIYLYVGINIMDFGAFIGTLSFTIFISFILYYFGIWSAGDAKYLLVLSLFIPNIGVIQFIGNIALLTLVYLLIYFLYFYIVKIGFNKEYRKALIENIIIDNKEKISFFLTNGNAGKIKRRLIVYKIFKSLIIFLTIFVILRLSRIYIIGELGENLNQSETNNLNIKEIFSNYLPYIALGGMILTFSLLFIFRHIYKLLFMYFVKYLKIDTKKTDINFKFLLIILILLISFIISEYLKTGQEVLNKLYLIFTLYLGLYLILKILFYSYKITFHLAENSYIDINDLKPGEIIDKSYLVKLFGTQSALGAGADNKNKELVMFSDPVKYFQSIDNPIDKETTEIIKKAYKKVNNYHNEVKTEFFKEKKDIKVLNTFAFSYYIFAGFLITFLIEDKIFKYISNIGYNIIKNIYY